MRHKPCGGRNFKLVGTGSAKEIGYFRVKCGRCRKNIGRFYPNKIDDYANDTDPLAKLGISEK